MTWSYQVLSFTLSSDFTVDFLFRQRKRPMNCLEIDLQLNRDVSDRMVVKMALTGFRMILDVLKLRCVSIHSVSMDDDAILGYHI